MVLHWRTVTLASRLQPCHAALQQIWHEKVNKLPTVEKKYVGGSQWFRWKTKP
jgi:hypothetical protein